MSRTVATLALVLGYLATAPSSFAADDDPFFNSIKVDDVVYARASSNGGWSVSIHEKGSATEEQKKQGYYYRAKIVTKQAILLRNLTGRREVWIPWHAVYSVSFEGEEIDEKKPE